MEFSFLLAVPAVFGAVLLETSKHFHTLVSDVDLVAYLLGVMASVFVGYISIGWLLKIVQMKRLGYFGIYCLFVGTGVVLFL